MFLARFLTIINIALAPPEFDMHKFKIINIMINRIYCKR